ncbi:VapC toxin family PIN domain ribonuclease [Actinomadura craniellae]|uniref:Ribonuclease VapC n=1 Tax=Actinomadura craniellae TaxID=2231787 RepID=A0A365H8I1_9ACTN|nr:PIN domain nuclease [Actinomadura craniellae]RAY15266.1 VapC toxin family PIN domain ribonuclease [Actinomadura craniellae]
MLTPEPPSVDRPWLADTFAVVRLLRDEQAYAQWEDMPAPRLVAICPITELEILYSARSPADRADLLDELGEVFGWLAVPDRAYERALAVQAELTAHGRHRAPGPVDLLVAATADLHGVTLLHYDRDFDQITNVSGQATQWLAEPGALDRPKG